MTHTLVSSINSKWTVFRRVSCIVTLLWLLAPAVWGAGSCDLNSDGQVNVVDVQVGVNQSLGAESCSSADINSDGQCNVVDVQLLINTALGSGCPAQLSGSSPAQPWVYGFTPKRIHYVDDVACGGNGTIGSPECDTTAFSTSHYQCGDLHLFRAGTSYLAGKGNTITELTKNCTQSAPVVFKGYVNPATGQPEQARTVAPVRATGHWTWIVGLEMINSESDSGGTLTLQADGAMAINNVLHDDIGSSNLSSWAWAKQVIYGNVLYRPGTNNPGNGHLLYTQNNFAADGWKYLIQNMHFEPTSGGQQMINMRTSSSGFVSGFHAEKNLFAEAPGFATWWSAPEMFNIVWKENYHSNFGSSSGRGLNITPNSPAQFEMTNNYFAKTSVNVESYWGASRPAPTRFTGNEIYDPIQGDHIKILQTGDLSGSAGSHKLSNSDAWDNNTYGGTFRVESLKCNGGTSGDLTLAEWRAATKNCRVTPGSSPGFDLNSRVVANPTVNKVVVLKNEWQCAGCTFSDQARGNVYIFNWANSANQTVNVSPVVGPNKQYVVRYARDFFGTAAASGTCPGSGACNVNLPIRRSSSGGTIFTGAYVITAEP